MDYWLLEAHDDYAWYDQSQLRLLAEIMVAEADELNETTVDGCLGLLRRMPVGHTMMFNGRRIMHCTWYV